MLGFFKALSSAIFRR